MLKRLISKTRSEATSSQFVADLDVRKSGPLRENPRHCEHLDIGIQLFDQLDTFRNCHRRPTCNLQAKNLRGGVPWDRPRWHALTLPGDGQALIESGAGVMRRL